MIISGEKEGRLLFCSSILWFFFWLWAHVHWYIWMNSMSLAVKVQYSREYVWLFKVLLTWGLIKLISKVGCFWYHLCSGNLKQSCMRVTYSYEFSGVTFHSTNKCQSCGKCVKQLPLENGLFLVSLTLRL